VGPPRGLVFGFEQGPAKTYLGTLYRIVRGWSTKKRPEGRYSKWRVPLAWA